MISQSEISTAEDSMKKANLKDMKKQNRQLVLQTLLEQGGLSRIEIAGSTQLSPSTITALTAELLEEGMLVESGVTVSTGGRRRTELAINPDFGRFLVVEIGRKQAQLHFYDMLLDETDCVTLPNYTCSGNDLLIGLTAAVMDSFSLQQLHAGKLTGIGLLYADDLQASDCNVMYSTSLSSASISLKEAVSSQFRVPVIEEYAAANSVTAVLQPEKAQIQNSVHIALQQNVLASVMLNGTPLPMRNGAQADITRYVQTTRNDVKATAAEPKSAEQKQASASSITGLVQSVSAIITFLCTLFPLDTVFLSGLPVKDKQFVSSVATALQETIGTLPMPEVYSIVPDERGAAHRMALTVRSRVLLPA